MGKKLLISILVIVFSISISGCYVTVNGSSKSLRGYSNCPSNNPYYFFEQNTKRKSNFRLIR